MIVRTGWPTEIHPDVPIRHGWLLVLVLLLQSLAVSGRASPLIKAIKANDVPGVKAALAAGEDPRLASVSPWTALHLAVPGNRPDLVDLLLKHGVAVNARDSFGVTPYMIFTGWKAFTAWSYWGGYDRTPDPRIGTLLLAAGADPNPRDYLGRSGPDLVQIVEGKREKVERGRSFRVIRRRLPEPFKDFPAWALYLVGGLSAAVLVELARAR